MAWGVEVENTASFLFEQHYDDLLNIARALRKRRQLSDTLQTSDLVNEAFLKLRKTPAWKDENHFMCSVSLAMRHVSIDHIKAKRAKKRGAGAQVTNFEGNEKAAAVAPISEAHLDVHALLGELTDTNERQAQIVDCRFFAGFTNQETARMLKIDERTVRREWHKARAWFALRLSSEQMPLDA